MNKLYILSLLIFFSILNISAESTKNKSKKVSKKDTQQEKVVNNEVAVEPTLIKKNGYSQMWDTTSTIESSFYKLIIPSAWEKYPNMSNGVEYNYSLTAKGGLPSSYNGSAVLTSFYISRQAGQNLDEAAQLVKTSRSKGSQSFEQSNKKVNNWEGILFESDYLQYLNGRDSKRYDLVIFSDKKNAAFLFSFVVLVKDSDGKFIKTFKINDYIEKIYENIWMNE